MEQTISITEDNKLIAEFDGCFPVYPAMDNSSKLSLWNRRNIVIQLSQIKYHSSWDWQIPVYTKLASASLRQAMRAEFKERYGYLHDKYIPCVEANNITQAWIYLTKTIEWYNKHIVEAKCAGG